MIDYMKRRLDENETSNILLAVIILTLIGSVAAVGYYLLDSISRWQGLGI